MPRRAPGPNTLAWVAGAVGRGARVVRGRPLQGGITAAIDQLTVETRTGARHQVVLRRWASRAPESVAEAARHVERESAVLVRLEQVDIPAPRCLAADPDGTASGVPAVLMTRVAGRIDLAPRDPKAWLRQMASMAVRIHEADINVPERPRAPRVVPVPPWTMRPADWRAAARLVAGPVPAHEVRFTHGDYQHFNLLWQRGRLTGVVDWVNASRGPADADVGHCRLNLAVLYSAELAADFLAAYEAEGGRRVDPYWDVRAVIATAFEDWTQFIPIQVGGRVPFDGAGMPRRVDDLLSAALRRR